MDLPGITSWEVTTRKGSPAACESTVVIRVQSDGGFQFNSTFPTRHRTTNQFSAMAGHTILEEDIYAKGYDDTVTNYTGDASKSGWQMPVCQCT